jgi:hypothetical protein
MEAARPPTRASAHLAGADGDAQPCGPGSRLGARAEDPREAGCYPARPRILRGR